MGELIALFNERKLLEIAISNGNLAELLSVSVGSEVRVKFISQSNANFFR
jgi:S-adenosylmethionine hydrolase